MAVETLVAPLAREHYARQARANRVRAGAVVGAANVRVLGAGGATSRPDAATATATATVGSAAMDALDDMDPDDDDD